MSLTTHDMVVAWCMTGWYDILLRMCVKIQAIVDRENLPFEFLQIKEKWGMLRIYVSGANEEIHAIIAEAENESSRTCEVCGKAGAVSGNVWLKTLCEECRSKK